LVQVWVLRVLPLLVVTCAEARYSVVSVVVSVDTLMLRPKLRHRPIVWQTPQQVI
jgi:hypothetical protein